MPLSEEARWTVYTTYLAETRFGDARHPTPEELACLLEDLGVSLDAIERCIEEEAGISLELPDTEAGPRGVLQAIARQAEQGLEPPADGEDAVEKLRGSLRAIKLAASLEGSPG